MRIAFCTSACESPRRVRASWRLGPISNTGQSSVTELVDNRQSPGKRSSFDVENRRCAPPPPGGYNGPPRGHSSAGRAPRWQRGGRRFEPGWLHSLSEPPVAARSVPFAPLRAALRGAAVLPAREPRWPRVAGRARAGRSRRRVVTVCPRCFGMPKHRHESVTERGRRRVGSTHGPRARDRRHPGRLLPRREVPARRARGGRRAGRSSPRRRSAPPARPSSMSVTSGTSPTPPS